MCDGKIYKLCAFTCWQVFKSQASDTYSTSTILPETVKMRLVTVATLLFASIALAIPVQDEAGLVCSSQF